jgi:hypothetical protein
VSAATGTDSLESNGLAGIIIGALLLLVVLGIVGWKFQKIQSEKAALLDEIARARDGGSGGKGDGRAPVVMMNAAYETVPWGGAGDAAAYFAPNAQQPALYDNANENASAYFAPNAQQPALYDQAKENASAYFAPNTQQPALYDHAKEAASAYLEPSAVQNDLYNTREAAGLYDRAAGVDPTDAGTYDEINTAAYC